MNTQKHTPAPWTAKTYSTETVRDAVGIYSGSMQLPIVPDIAGRSIEECDANISLIAAAPDLLAALKVMDEAFSHYAEGDPSDEEIVAIHIAREAIYKATGKAA